MAGLQLVVPHFTLVAVLLLIVTEVGLVLIMIFWVMGEVLAMDVFIVDRVCVLVAAVEGRM